MNVIFLGLGKYKTIKNRGIYLDLLRVFIEKGHEVYIVTSLEPESKEQYKLIEEEHSHILRVRTGKITKANIVEKGINTLLLDGRYIKAIDKYFGDVKFDLVLYPTPPITFLKVVEHIKKRDGATTYLLLKDIFPQNAVDIGMLSKSGMKGILYRYFRKREKRLYRVSDFIGCMSQANVDYILKHNLGIDASCVEVCPNSTDIEDKSIDKITRKEIREKYGIPQDKKVFVYGGNLGKPQGIPFLIECLKTVRDVENAFFLVVGAGTEYRKLEEYANAAKQENFKLMNHLPKNDYDTMVGACDVGLIFLDHRFTIPNFPSRLLSYMSAKLPVLAVTDPNTDIGNVVVDGGFGWWCESNDAKRFVEIVEKASNDNTEELGDRAFNYLKENYDVKLQYQVIMNRIVG